MCAVYSVMSHSLQPHGLQPTILLSPWNFPGKNTGVGCHFLLQGIFLAQGSNPHLLCLLHWQADFLPLSYQGSPKIHWKTKYKLTCSNFHFSVSTRETLDDSVKPDFLQVHQTKPSFTKSISKFKLVHHQNHLWLTSRESEELIDPHNTVKAVTHKIQKSRLSLTIREAVPRKINSQNSGLWRKIRATPLGWCLGEEENISTSTGGHPSIPDEQRRYVCTNTHTHTLGTETQLRAILHQDTIPIIKTCMFPVILLS